jgi:hypothetical protein
MPAVTPTEVLATMFHCMPSDEYPYPARPPRWKQPSTCSGVNPSQMPACPVHIQSQGYSTASVTAIVPPGRADTCSKNAFTSPLFTPPVWH